MSIESDLVSHLKNDSAITDLVENRISPLMGLQNTAYPFITYFVVSDISNQCIGGSVYQNDTRFQIDVWDTKYSKVKAIKEAVLSALKGFKSSYAISNMDDYEPDTKLYRQLVDFKLKG